MINNNKNNKVFKNKILIIHLFKIMSKIVNIVFMKRMNTPINNIKANFKMIRINSNKNIILIQIKFNNNHKFFNNKHIPKINSMIIKKLNKDLNLKNLFANNNNNNNLVVEEGIIKGKLLINFL